MKNNQKAFTIVELLVVIVVIGVLASIALVSYTGISKKATEASVVSDLANTSQRLKLYQIENSSYPDDASKLIECPTPSSGSMCIKLSPNNALGIYYVNKTVTPHTFCLTIKNGTNIKKNITHEGIISDGACTYPFPVSLTSNSVTPTSSAISLSWPSIIGTIDGYILERATDSNFTTNLTQLTAPAPGVTTYTSSGLTSGTTYYYHMKVTMAGDTSSWSNTTSNTTKSTLVVAAGANGTVDTSVNGDYNIGDAPTITATPNPNYVFSSWSGSAGCSGTASHTITIDASKTCTANFTLITYTLTITAGANGAVNAGGTYPSGTSRTITATSSAPYVFSSWSGSVGCNGIASHAVIVDSNKTCNASFVIDTANWSAGSGVLAGKYVYKTDAPGGAIYSPAGDYTVGCIVGGRWPNIDELWEIYTNRASYGNNFQAFGYWSSTGIYNINFSSGTQYSSAPSFLKNVRCVAG